jgi:dienelactone hydrolase
VTHTYRHLGPFSDWVDKARQLHDLYPLHAPGTELQGLVREALGFCGNEEAPAEVRVEHRWECDGLAGEEVSWSVGYGPRTHAWILKPAQVSEPLPGVVALHCHSGFKFYGKEKIADGPEQPHETVVQLRERIYGGRAFANDLAKRGFVVLVNDTFLWGSRRFPLEPVLEAEPREPGSSAVTTTRIERYNEAAHSHEHLIAKYCTLLGTTLAGVVAYEDRVAARYLQSRPDVMAGHIGCVGLSGGGCRAALLQATFDDMDATVIVGMMSTYEALLDHNVESHTWMFFPAGLARFGDWPDLAACRAPSPLMVQYDRDDHLFTAEGMQSAHRRIAKQYQRTGNPDAYTGEFHAGPHAFDREMQESAFSWLKIQLDR